MRAIGFDTETYLITDTDKAPKVVCCTWYDGAKSFITRPDDPQTYAMWTDRDAVFLGVNLAYDLVALMRWHPQLIPHIIRALDEGRIIDVSLRDCLIHLGQHGTPGYNPRPSLAELALKYLNLDLSKWKEGDDIWRLKYGTLDPLPFNEWPKEALEYALDDAKHPWHIFQAQGGFDNPQATEALQNQAAVVLHAIGTYGFGINQETRGKIQTALLTEKAALDKVLAEKGIDWIGKGSQARMAQALIAGWHRKHRGMLENHAAATGVQMDTVFWDQWIPQTENVKRMLERCAEKGEAPPGMSVPHQFDWMAWCQEVNKTLPEIPHTTRGPSTSEETLGLIADCLPGGAEYLESKHKQKMLSTYIEPCVNDTMHASFVPMVSTGRTGCRNVNLQNIPRKDKARPSEAFRTMFQARKGRILGTVDYSQLELCTLSATIRHFLPDVPCRMGEAIDNDMDVHCITGGTISGRSYEAMLAGKKTDPAIVDARQAAKACIAHGSPVLVQHKGTRGAYWCPIQLVTSQHRVWDGVEWVEHAGVEKRGVKRVRRLSQVVAVTPDHMVFSSDTRMTQAGHVLEQGLLEEALTFGRLGSLVTEPEEDHEIGVVKDGDESQVYDIVNAGPRHRFQCGQFIVANCNFGLPGGLGVGAFLSYAKNNYGVNIPHKDGWRMINGWKQTWPEVVTYLAWNGGIVGKGRGTGYTVTGRPKANCFYTEINNFRFQGLAADGAKAALWGVWRECMLGWYWSQRPRLGYGSELGDSPLRDSRLVNFVHDEIVAEHPQGDQGKAALKRQEEIMVERMHVTCRKLVTIRVEGKLSDQWEH